MPHRSDTLYDDLELEGAETMIRLMHIEKATEIDAPLHATLEVCSLGSETPSYTALSYTWHVDYSHQEPPPSLAHDGYWIVCNGHRRQVTENLYSALRTLRYLGHEVAWVDQICTDQTDPDDRDAQVSIMDQIYSRADMTFIYLGEETETSRSALKHYTEVKAHVQRYIESRKAHVHRSSPDFPRLDWGIISEWTELYNTYAWFYRIWVIQELLLARRCVFAVGRNEYDATVLLDGPGAFLEQFYGESDAGYNMENWKYVRNLGCWLFVIQRYRIIRGSTGKVGPLQVLQYLRTFGATDARDRLYAVRSMLGLTIKPDYNSSISAVYTKFAQDLLSEDTRYIYNMLLYSGKQLQYQPDLPSWVPDWSAQGITTAAGSPSCTISKANLSRVNLTTVKRAVGLIDMTDVRVYDRNNPLVSFVKCNAGEIALSGVLLGQVKSLTSSLWCYDKSKKLWILARWHREARRLMYQTYSPRYPSYSGRLLGLIRLLKDINSGPKSLIEYLRRTEKIEHSLATGAPLSDEFLANFFWGHRVCFTSNGHMAAVPAGSEMDDWIALVSGHEWPIVLRRVHSSPGRYQLIGGANVLDLIQGGEPKQMGWDPQVFIVT